MGGQATCAIRDDRTLTCTENVIPPAGEFVGVTAGFDFYCAIRVNGRVECWGDLVARDSSSLAPPSGTFALISAGWQHVCGVRTDGVTECWGADDSPQSTPPIDFP